MEVIGCYLFWFLRETWADNGVIGPRGWCGARRLAAVAPEVSGGGVVGYDVGFSFGAGCILRGSGVGMSQSIEPFETAEASGYPRVTQMSIFLEDRVGQLLRLTTVLDKTDVHIVALSIVNTIDCAVVRMIVDDVDTGYAALREANFPIAESELLCVSVPHGKRGLLNIWKALLGGEVNVNYTYPLLIQPLGCSALAVNADNLDMAGAALQTQGYTILDQDQLRDLY